MSHEQRLTPFLLCGAPAGDEQEGQRGQVLGRLRDDDPEAVLPGDPLPHLRDQP
jgi:hypothetical protein